MKTGQQQSLTQVGFTVVIIGLVLIAIVYAGRLFLGATSPNSHNLVVHQNQSSINAFFLPDNTYYTFVSSLDDCHEMVFQPSSRPQDVAPPLKGSQIDLSMDDVGKIICFKARSNKEDTYVYTAQEIKAWWLEDAQTDFVGPVIIIDSTHANIFTIMASDDHSGLQELAYREIQENDPNSQCGGETVIEDESDSLDFTYSTASSNQASNTISLVVPTGGIDICIRAIDNAGNISFRQVSLAYTKILNGNEATLLPDNWDQLSLEEKQALNPYGCLYVNQMRLEDGQCFPDESEDNSDS